MTKEDIQKAYDILLLQQVEYNENRSYVEGKNPAILSKKKAKDPDNRIPVPLAKLAVSDMTGYAGSNISVHYKNVTAIETKDSAEDKKTDEYNDLMQQIQKHNDDKLVMSEVYRECLTQKEAYLLFWVSNELDLKKGMLTPEYQLVTMNEMVVFYTKTLKPKIETAVRFIFDEEKTIEAIVYYPKYAEAWINKDGAGWFRNSDNDIKYPYASTPVITYKMSKKGGAIFNPQKPLMDALDSSFSKTQNELDRFNALIALFPGKVTKEFIDKLEEMKILDDLSQYERWPEYLEKNLAGVELYTNKQMDRGERYFHKTIEIPDFSSSEFATGDESGVARAFKLIGMEWAATTIESYFKKGFMQRKQLFDDVLEVSVYKLKKDDYISVVEMKRNLPVDEATKVQLAATLKGAISDDAFLRILPETIIPDVEQEKANKMKEEPDTNEIDEVNNAV